MNKKKKIILLAVFVTLASAFVVMSKEKEPVQKAGPDLSEINFSKPGYIRDQEPENPNRGMYLLYEEPGAPALLAKLIFDADSMCTFTEKSLNCMALSSIMETIIGEKRVFVEGIKNGDDVLVKNISID